MTTTPPRRTPCAAVLCGTLLLLAGCAREAPPAAPAPGAPHRSVLLVTLDTTRADHVGAYGVGAARTPAFDRVAHEGALFLRAWTTAPLTAPAHASLLTGLYPAGHGVRNNDRARLPADLPVLAAILRAAGYRTGGFVAGFPVSRTFGFERGFDLFDDDFGTGPGGQPLSERRADRVAAPALAWIRERLARRGEAPFLAWVHFYDAHAPYVPPPPFALDFAGRPYDGEIAFADHALGELIAALEEAHALDDTLVVVAGDHGEGLGAHGEDTHGIFLYEPMVRVPLALRAPWAATAGTRVERPVSLVDVLPTVLRLVGLPPPAGLHGEDLLASPAPSPAPPPGSVRALAGTGAARLLACESLYGRDERGWAPLFAARRGDVKLVLAPRPEKYLLDTDPGETRDVHAGSADDARLARALAELLRAAEEERAAREGEAAPPADEIDEAARERLRSLGYLAHGPGERPEASGLDPKDAMLAWGRYLEATKLMRTPPDGFARAVPVLRSLVAAEPRNREYRLKLGQAQSLSGNPGGAEETWRRLAADFPDDETAPLVLSLYLASAGCAAEDRDLLLAFLDRVPGSPRAARRLAEAFLAGGDPDQAIALSRSWSAEHGPDALLLASEARAWRALGRDDEALAAARAAMALATAPAAVDVAADVLAARGEADQARAVVREALGRAPGDLGLAAVAVRHGVTP